MVTMDRWSQVTMFVQPKYKYAESTSSWGEMLPGNGWIKLHQFQVELKTKVRGSGINPRTVSTREIGMQRSYAMGGLVNIYS